MNASDSIGNSAAQVISFEKKSVVVAESEQEAHTRQIKKRLRLKKYLLIEFTTLHVSGF